MKLALTLLVAVSDAKRVVRSRVSPLPERLQSRGPSSAADLLETLDVALVSSNVPSLEREIERRADPRSPSYAQWLSVEEVTSYVQASDKAINQVTAWLRAAGLEPKLNVHRDYLTAHNVSATTVEELLGAKLHKHYDVMTGQTVHRVPGEYSLPADVAPYVDKIFPVHSVPLGNSIKSSARNSDSVVATESNTEWPSDCGLTKRGIITPAVTRALYNYTEQGGSLQSSVAALLSPPIGMDHTAVAYLQEQCDLPNHPFDKFVGKNYEADCSKKNPSEGKCYEAALDAQVIGSTAIGCHLEFWSPEDPSFISFFKKLNEAGDAAPRVVSMSFADVETERDDDTTHTEKELAKLVAKGITLVAGSGDNGAGYRRLKGTYYTNYPASSKYVLSVGGTSLKQFGELHSGEVGNKDGYSSGGFSSLWKAPSWQSAATASYFKTGAKTPSSGFDKGGRGVPDIAALSGTGDSETWQVRIGGKWEGMSGTSSSTPFIASLVAKLNAKRVAAGMGTMGFMNPWLYSAVASSHALYDVTEGYNTNKDGGKETSFYCAEGWDPVTGLGTPNYEVLEKLALQTQDLIV